MEEIVIIGGGGHAKVLVSLLRKLNSYNILGYTDLADRGQLFGFKYLGADEILRERALVEKELNVAIGIGQIGLGRNRESAETRLRGLAMKFPCIVSPGAIVNEGVSLASGVSVMDGAVINSGASIGRGTILNSNCTVEHDVQVGEWVHVAPGSTISGGVIIGRYSMVGAGAVVIEGRRIGSDCIIGAGSTVIHDLTDPGTYVGSPARRIR